MSDQCQDRSGTLYVVATPIGNLEDMTFRAIRILKSVDLIAAEDTRHTGKLLAHYGIKNSLVSCHDHNEASRIPEFISRLKQGGHLALVSDAGTPSVSDPGYRLVQAAVKEKIKVIPVPGPSAAVAALCVSGLPTDRFLFSGFLARKKGKRIKELQDLEKQAASLIFYESPKRIAGLIRDIIAVMGDRDAMLAREITKLHEEYLYGPLSHILEQVENRSSVKGECTLVVQGSDDDVPASGIDLEAAILEALESEDVPTSTLAARLSETLGLRKKIVYDKIISLKKH